MAEERTYSPAEQARIAQILVEQKYDAIKDMGVEVFFQRHTVETTYHGIDNKSAPDALLADIQSNIGDERRTLAEINAVIKQGIRERTQNPFVNTDTLVEQISAKFQVDEAVLETALSRQSEPSRGENVSRESPKEDTNPSPQPATEKAPNQQEAQKEEELGQQQTQRMNMQPGMGGLGVIFAMIAQFFQSITQGAGNMLADSPTFNTLMNGGRAPQREVDASISQEVISEIQQGVQKDIDEVDRNGDGQMNREEFSERIDQSLKTEGVDREKMKDITFNGLDVNKDGLVSAEEVVDPYRPAIEQLAEDNPEVLKEFQNALKDGADLSESSLVTTVVSKDRGAARSR